MDGGAHGHRRVHAEHPGFVGRGGDNPPVLRAATDQHRLANQFRVVQLLDSGVEGVQVGVDDVTQLPSPRLSVTQVSKSKVRITYFTAIGTAGQPIGFRRIIRIPNDGGSSRHTVHWTSITEAALIMVPVFWGMLHRFPDWIAADGLWFGHGYLAGRHQRPLRDGPRIHEVSGQMQLVPA